MTVSTETVHLAKSRPRKNQSECLDLPRYKIIKGNKSQNDSNIEPY